MVTQPVTSNQQQATPCLHDDHLRSLSFRFTEANASYLDTICGTVKTWEPQGSPKTFRHLGFDLGSPGLLYIERPQSKPTPPASPVTGSATPLEGAHIPVTIGI
jgi:hypothetical protein